MNKLFLYLLFFIGFFFTSCVSRKDLIYLQEKNAVSEAAINPVALKPYRLQINDVLGINIKAIDSKLVEIFNGGESQQLASADGLYFNGYSVDDHGNIRMPILGEINV